MGVKRKLQLLLAGFLALSCVEFIPACLTSASIEPSQSEDAPWAIDEGWEITWYVDTYNISNMTLLDNRNVLLAVTGIESSGTGAGFTWEIKGDLQLNPGLLMDWEYIVIDQVFYRYKPNTLDYEITTHARGYRTYILPVHLSEPLLWFEDGINVIYNDTNWNFTRLTSDVEEGLEYSLVITNKSNSNNTITMIFNNNGILKSITENDVNGTTYFHMYLESATPPSNIDTIVITVFVVAGLGAVVLIVIYFIIKRKKLSVEEIVDGDQDENLGDGPFQP